MVPKSVGLKDSEIDNEIEKDNAIRNQSVLSNNHDNILNQQRLSFVKNIHPKG